MAESTISIGKLPKFAKDVAAKLSAVIAEETKQKAIQEVQRQIKKVNAVASGQFLQSITADFTKLRGSSYLVSVGSLDRAAEAIESGLPPTNVPIEDILKWMSDKGIGDDIETAYYIQYKLAEEGYEARGVFSKAEDALSEKIDDIINDILNRDEFYRG